MWQVERDALADSEVDGAGQGAVVCRARASEKSQSCPSGPPTVFSRNQSTGQDAAAGIQPMARPCQ
jgi:hypothetical protein